MSDLTVGIHDTWTVIHISVGKHDTWTISDLTVGTVSILWSVFAGVAILVFVVNLVDVQFKSPKAFYSKYIARDVCGAIIWLASNTEMFCKRNPSTVCREKKNTWNFYLRVDSSKIYVLLWYHECWTPQSFAVLSHFVHLKQLLFFLGI